MVKKRTKPINNKEENKKTNKFYVVKLYDDGEDYYFRNKDNAYECLWTLYLRHGIDNYFLNEEEIEREKEINRKVLDANGYIWNFGEVEVVGFED